MDAIEALLTRRSIRRYTPEPVSRQDIDTMLAAAMAGPTAHNMQTWRFVVVRDEAVREELSRASKWGGMIADAPLAIVVCGDTTAEKEPDTYWVQDATAALENILIAAHALGLGAMWVGVHPDQEKSAKVAAALALPENIKPLGMVAIGHPAEAKPPSERLDWDKVRMERWR